MSHGSVINKEAMSDSQSVSGSEYVNKNKAYRLAVASVLNTLKPQKGTGYLLWRGLVARRTHAPRTGARHRFLC